MFRLSNNLLGILNFVIFVVSVPILGAGIWLANRASTDCEKFLEKPVIAIGVFLMVVSLAGLIGACCRVTWLLWIYLFVMFVLIVLLFCFTVFAFVVTNKGAGEVVSGKGYKEYKLGDYSNWLQKRVTNHKNWRKIESCIRQAKVCEKLAEKNDTITDFFKENLSPLQSGCCKPPSSCNFDIVNATHWKKNNETGTSSYTDTDCTEWSNDLSKLCYSCNSCKAGVLANIKNDWKKVAIINIVFLVILILVYSIGCCAFRNNRKDSYYDKQLGRP